MRRSTAIAVIVALFGFPHCTPVAGNLWTGAGGDNLWNTVDNWSQAIVPVNSTSHPRDGWDDPEGPLYPLTPDPSDDRPLWNNDVKLQENGTITLVDDSVGVASAYGVRVGNGGATNTLQITGGRVDIGIDPDADPSANNVGWHLQVGRGYPGFDGGPVNENPLATVLMSGGTVITNGLLIPEQFVNHSLPDPTDSAPLNGELIMSGGVINARWMNLGQLKGNGRAELSGNAVINLAPNVPNNPNNGGHLEFNRNWFLNGQPVPSSGNVRFDIRDNAIVNIYGHRSESRSTPNAAERDRYQSYIDSGELTADNDTDDPTIYFDQAEGVIRICALDADFDLDCDADMDDHATWQSGYGTIAAALKADGDADNDGNVDGHDLLELQKEFGVGVSGASPTTTVVPEPKTLALWLLGAIALAARHVKN